MHTCLARLGGWLSAGGLLLLLAVSWVLVPSEVRGDDDPVGTERRTLWTSSRVNGAPDPPSPYRIASAFPQLKFNEPLDLTSAPGSDRLYVAERFGKIYSFPLQGNSVRADLLIDLQRTLYGIAFHPQFARNGYFYVSYILDPKTDDPRGSRVSRFQVSQDRRLQADPKTEKVILEWASGGHNGGCMKFGPDGFLYVGTGDSSGIADQHQTGQDMTTLSGKILRIDVDQPAGDRAYAIPNDNPFRETTGARGEIWAYGLRQPWKMSFDTKTGDLWAGNVGQDLWEQIFLIERGGNYGWSVMEGSHPFRPERPRGPTPFVAPVVEHDHAEFRSITGGFVYHGTRLAELTGAYIYGDYDTGKVWMFRYDRESRKVSEHQELVDSALRLVGFAEDHAGELYLLDHMSGLLHRLEKNPAFGQVVDFPRKLSDTGLFAAVDKLEPAPGVIRYSVLAPQWSDGATKERWLAIPGDGQIEFDGITYPQPAPGAPHGWKFPNGTVAVETLSMEMEKGNPASRRRLETRILHYEKLLGSEDVGDQYWRGYTYLWNDEQTDAVLVEDVNGKDLPLTIKDSAAPGGQYTQTWRVPSRAECTVCHNMAAKYVLGINTLQLNRDHDYGGTIDNQLRRFERLGLFEKRLPMPPAKLARLVDYSATTADLNDRARSYLHANCSHCHRKWGGGNTEFLLLSTVGLPDMGIASVRPGHGGFFIPDADILAPGDPYRSVLLYRVSKLGPGRMPRIGSNVVDETGQKLLHDWIASLPPSAPKTETATQAIAQMQENRSAEARAQQIGQLLATTGTAMRLVYMIDSNQLAEQVRDEVLALGTNHEAAHIRDLFERYLPEEKRPKRLGSVVRPSEILALAGDAERGRKLFLEAAGVQCRNCHKLQGQGTEVGPDLSQVGKKYPDRARLLDTILDPSREIDPAFRVHLVQTSDGQVYTGLLVKKDDQQVVLKDAKNKLTVIPAGDAEEVIPQQQSMMPDLLLRDLTKEQVADLLEFLSSLK